MSFLRKKKVKFNVELIVQKFTDVPLLNAMIFAKVRLLDCGSFVGVTWHRPVCSHQVDFMCSSSFSDNPQESDIDTIRLRVKTVSGHYLQPQPNINGHRHSTTGLIDDMALPKDKSLQLERRHSISEGSPREFLNKRNQLELEDKQSNNKDIEMNVREEGYVDEDGNLVSIEKNPQPFEFVCYIPYDSKYTGELEACRCKISLRKEDRAGRTPQKLGFVILNLSEYAGTGSEGVCKSFLLDGYGSSQRQDNSRVHIYIKMQHNSADPLFKVPNLATTSLHQNGSNEDLLRQYESLGYWLNPIDRKAPPPSPIQIPNSNGTGTLLQLVTTSSSNAVQAQTDSTIFTSNQTIMPSTSLPSSLCANVSTFSTVPGGLGHNMSIRVQRTRRDPGDVIEEVLAENSATISEIYNENVRHSSISSNSSGEYESS